MIGLCKNGQINRNLTINLTTLHIKIFFQILKNTNIQKKYIELILTYSQNTKNRVMRLSPLTILQIETIWPCAYKQMARSQNWAMIEINNFPYQVVKIYYTSKHYYVITIICNSVNTIMHPEQKCTFLHFHNEVSNTYPTPTIKNCKNGSFLRSTFNWHMIWLGKGNV